MTRMILVHRHDQLVIHGEQTRLVGLAVLIRKHEGIKFEPAGIRVAIAPEPLLAGGLHGDIRGREIELREKQPEGRDRDNGENDDRHHGPEYFKQRVVRGPRWRRVRFGVELDDDDEQKPQDEEGNEGDDDEQAIVELDDLSITSVAAGCKFISQGWGWAAERRCRPSSQRKIIPKAMNCLNTCIVVFAPSTRKSAVGVLPNVHRSLNSRHAPQSATLRAGAAGQGRSPGFSNHNSGPVAMTKSSSAMRQHCLWLFRKGGHRP